MQPCTGSRPISLHCSRSNFQCRRNLQGEPGKKAQFYNSALARIDFGQTYKSIIEATMSISFRRDIIVPSSRESLGTLAPRFAAPLRRA